MSVRKRGERYQVRVRLGSGQRIERTLPPGASRADARALEDAIRRRHIDTSTGRRPDRLIEEALQQWEPQARALKSWERDLKYRVAVLRENYTAGRRLDDLGEVAEEIKRTGLAGGAKPATINRYLSILRRIGNLAVRWGWTDKPLGQRVQLLGGEEARHVYLTGDQVRDLMTACTHAEARDLILFATLTGLRRSEILRLQPGDVRDDCVLLDARTKSGKPRAVPLPPQALRIAETRLPWTISARTLHAEFVKAKEAAGMPHVRLHDLRHTYASWLAQGGASLAAIRDLLGHSSLAVTSRYSHLARPDLVRVTRKLRVKIG